MKGSLPFRERKISVWEYLEPIRTCASLARALSSAALSFALSSLTSSERWTASAACLHMGGGKRRGDVDNLKESDTFIQVPRTDGHCLVHVVRKDTKKQRKFYPLTPL